MPPHVIKLKPMQITEMKNPIVAFEKESMDSPCSIYSNPRYGWESTTHHQSRELPQPTFYKSKDDSALGKEVSHFYNDYNKE